jgi:hypothetical protein
MIRNFITVTGRPSAFSALGYELTTLAAVQL